MHYFLIASLPLLEIGEVPPMTVAEFDEILKENLSETAQKKIFAYEGKKDYPDTCPIYRKMALFESYLRTCIARKRAERAGIQFSAADPEEYYGEVDYTLAHASSCSNPLEREYMIDRLRWARLEELALGHDFDFDALCIYRAQLFIVNKYAGFRTETGTVNFSAALEKVVSLCGKNTKES